ncbi:MAG: TldD/PmbA family protein [Dehalococcoidia bacterium]|nr:TldD/PmbA family protein [Dehalococcoidia bacterium]
MRDLITDALKGHGVDYAEIRVEESVGSRITYRGKELEDIGRTSGIGGNVRALYKGGWGFVTFNDLSNLKEKVALAAREARLVGKEKSVLAPVDPVVDSFKPVLKKDPLTVSLAEKTRLLEEYVEVIWASPGIQTSAIRYSDSRRKLLFASSEGSFIEQEKVDMSAGLTVIVRQDGNVQQASLSLGSAEDFGFIEGIHSQVKETTDRAIALLSASRPKGGEYTVICDPVLSGVFVHEAFGHLSESDFVYENERMKEVMVLGRRFGNPILNIVDGAAIPGLRGSYKYDDEGVPSTKTYLITEGILTGRLHSRETAGKMGEPVTGNARAINFRYPPIVRMTNTLIEPGKTSFADMIADVKEGIYAKNWYGGTTSMEMFTFSAGESFMIRNGKIAEPLQGVVLSGNLFSTLHNIDAIGDDPGMTQGGGCGKGGQAPRPVANGGPLIRIRKCVIGGE